jgi:hypothetical protein
LGIGLIEKAEKVLNQFEDMPTFTINKKDILEGTLQKDFDFH